MFELILDVERYGGAHGPFACLDLNNNEAFEMFRYEDEDEVALYADFRVSDELLQILREIPPIDNYRLGSYWTGSSPDTKRFIEDRLKWLRKALICQLKQARQYYRILLAWNLDSEDTPLPYYRLV